MTEDPKPPDERLKCGALKEQFAQLLVQEMSTVPRSRKTNYLHTSASTLLRELLAMLLLSIILALGLGTALCRAL